MSTFVFKFRIPDFSPNLFPSVENQNLARTQKSEFLLIRGCGSTDYGLSRKLMVEFCGKLYTYVRRMWFSMIHPNFMLNCESLFSEKCGGNGSKRIKSETCDFANFTPSFSTSIKTFRWEKPKALYLGRGCGRKGVGINKDGFCRIFWYFRRVPDGS